AELTSDGSMMVNTPCDLFNIEFCYWSVILWDMETGETNYGLQLGDNTYVSDAKFSPDDRLLALATCQIENSENNIFMSNCDDILIYDISQLPISDNGEFIRIDDE